MTRSSGSSSSTSSCFPPDRIEVRRRHDRARRGRPNRTLIRATKPGDLEAAEWRDVYGDIEEGWITFFNSSAIASPAIRARPAARSSAPAKGTLPELPGEPWHESRYQRGADVDGELLVVFAKPEGEATMLVTTYDLDDEAFAAAEARWEAWWAGAAPSP